MHPDVGTVVDGRYELCELAGEGGMASVWKGKVLGAAGFSRPVAIKKMKEQLGFSLTQLSPRTLGELL